MAESYPEDDLATLRAIARGQGIAGAESMSRDRLMDALRDAGVSAASGEPVGSPAEGPQTYHGVGVGRRERIDVGDGAASDAGDGRTGSG